MPRKREMAPSRFSCKHSMTVGIRYAAVYWRSSETRVGMIKVTSWVGVGDGGGGREGPGVSGEDLLCV